MIKRILTSIIGLPLVVLIIVFGNIYVMDIFMMLVALICMYEYYSVIDKISTPIKWIGYLSTVLIALPSLLEETIIMRTILFGIPIIIAILFFYVVVTDMKITFKDVAYTFLGIFYITGFIVFLSLIRSLENGRTILGYTIVVAWSTDIFAYLFGKMLGKHKFSKVSPKKTIEGCLGGIFGAVVCGLIYIVFFNKHINLNIQNIYFVMMIVTLILSVISQLGDFAASSIKRFADQKDYGNLLPGHGGMLDRIDSLIFIAPFVYIFFTII